jgi:2-dehydro-3-deoxygluconokinase
VRTKTILCFGEMLLRLSAPDKEPLLRSASLDAAFGGTEANVAVSLSHFGLQGRIVTALPANDLGDACLGELRRYGADTTGIRRAVGRMGLYFLTPGAMLRPSRLFYDRAGSVFAQADPGIYDWPALLTGVDWLHVSGVTPAVSANAAQAARAAVAAAAARKIPVSFDCNFRASLWQDRGQEAADALRHFARQATLLFAGPFDVAKLFGLDADDKPADEAHRLAAAQAFAACPGLRHVAGTHRKIHSADHQTLTAYLADRDGQSVSRAYELNPIVERIGGGDAFAAGILYGLCQSMDRQQAVDFAAAATALKHAACGDFNTADVEDVRFLVENGAADVQR